MGKGKERSVNPAQEHRKLEKAKALKKGKAELQARRNEKLARRNPDRLQRQIDDLKALEESGSIRKREKQILEGLEKDFRAVRKAREALGDKAPTYANRSTSGNKETQKPQNGLLGKRNWNGARKSKCESSGSETDESVRRIPMPNDTPPPIPRRPREDRGTHANAEPVAASRPIGRQPGNSEGTPMQSQPKTTYESAPQIRDLRKEAVARFVPNMVRKKKDAIEGTGSLVEPEELDELEEQGYGCQTKETDQTVSWKQPSDSAVKISCGIGAAAAEDDAAEIRRLAEEEDRFRRETKYVQMEEVQHDDM